MLYVIHLFPYIKPLNVQPFNPLTTGTEYIRVFIYY